MALQHCECNQCHIINVKIAEMVDFMLHILYHNKNVFKKFVKPTTLLLCSPNIYCQINVNEINRKYKVTFDESKECIINLCQRPNTDVIV